MQTAGRVIAGIGALGALLALSMNVTVETEYGAVNNIGLMNDRQNYLILSALMVVVGVVMILSGKKSGQGEIGERKRSEPIEPLPYGILEDQGLFMWGGKAFPTRDDAVAYVKQRLAEHAARSAADRP